MILFLFKVLVVVVLAILIRGMLPRYRIDQFVFRNWRSMIFVYLGFVFLLFCWSFFFQFI